MIAAFASYLAGFFMYGLFMGIAVSIMELDDYPFKDKYMNYALYFWCVVFWPLILAGGVLFMLFVIVFGTYKLINKATENADQIIDAGTKAVSKTTEAVDRWIGD